MDGCPEFFFSDGELKICRHAATLFRKQKIQHYLALISQLNEMNYFRERNEIDLFKQFVSTKENFTFRLHNVTYPEINWIIIFH